MPTVAQALRFRFYGEGEPRQQLLDYLREKHILLIMDNYEHLLAPAALPSEGSGLVSPPLRAKCPPSADQLAGQVSEAPGRTQGGEGLVAEILKAAPQVKILATSRAVLNIQGENLFPIAGMDLPGQDTTGETLDTAEIVAGYSSIKLFLTAARRAQPDFEATDDVVQDIVRVCQLVQGIPLGILLAAAWADFLTPAEIADEIAQSIDFLETDVRDVPERQRSVRSVFDHSWKLLTEGEQEVLAALSVFRGGFTRRAAQQVASASLRDLKGLVEKSLLDRGSRGRYELHELLRQYAAEALTASLVELEAARERHCAFFAGFIARRGEDLKGAQQATALAEIEADSDNARRAWNWAVERGQIERLDRAMEGLFLYYEGRGRYPEGRTACQVAEGRLAGISSPDAVRVRARILTWQSIFEEGMGRFETAHHLPRTSLSLLDESVLVSHDTRSERAFALRQTGNMASWSADRQEVQRCYEESLALCRELGDRWGTADALFGLGWLAVMSGAYDDAERLLGESLAIRRELGDRKGMPATLMELSSTAMHQAQFEKSERLAREIITIGQELADPASLATGLRHLGWSLMWLGRFHEGQSPLEESVAIHNELGSQGWAAQAIVALGSIEMHLGYYEKARAQGQRALTLARPLGAQNTVGISLNLMGMSALALKTYPEAERHFQESVALYRTLEYLGHLCLTLVGLGATAYSVGDLRQARAYLCEALETAARIGSGSAILHALPAATLLLCKQGDAERAVEIYALASRYPYVANSRWFEDVAGKQIASAVDSLPPDVVSAAQDRGRALDLWETAEALLHELDW